ncbi:gem-associated protein 6-like [Ruditapes philippinarum]|uniref:gem-associated protein 6-like n=1 Tax=Ruditapes philippinarum TaxID=129788 RepID=UPI00295BA66C|nr:gem-associated protein 6-like [Ruditapes philippinarum]
MEEESDIHPIFTKDPEEWMQYVYKKVSILLDDGAECCGYVYTIDPVSETFVLVNFSNDKTSLQLVLKHAVTSITVLSEDVELYKQKLDNLFRFKSQESLSEEDLKRRQNIVKSWLLKNRLPVEINGELLNVAEALVIQPPYGSENCVSTNEIILGKIQGLIKNMPADQDEW